MHFQDNIIDKSATTLNIDCKTYMKIEKQKRRCFKEQKTKIKVDFAFKFEINSI